MCDQNRRRWIAYRSLDSVGVNCNHSVRSLSRVQPNSCGGLVGGAGCSSDGMTAKDERDNLTGYVLVHRHEPVDGHVHASFLGNLTNGALFGCFVQL